MTIAPPQPEAGRRSWRRFRLVARVAVIVGAGYLGVLVVSSNSAELSGAAGYLARLRWVWLVAAVFAEVVSYLAYAQLQKRLLAAGAVKAPLVPLLGVALAGNAMTSSLPGGGAFATVFAYRQFRRLGADEAVTTWTVVAFTALAAITLAFLAAIGLVVVGEDGPVGGLWPLLAALIAVPVLGVAILLRPRLLAVFKRPVAAVVRLFPGERDTAAIIDRLIQRLEAVTPGWTDWLSGLGWALANWVADCSCLVLAFVAVGTPVPWRGVLVAYGAAQVAANLPITPGGLGVVEGSLTVALVAYGGSTTGSVAAVLLYRIISFWALLPIGWLAWLTLHAVGRREPAPSIVATEAAP